MVNRYDRTEHDGKTVDWLTKAALLAVEHDLGYALTIVQGSYHGGVSQSAGTHDGGGVVDLLAWDHARKVAALRRVGFAAWYRPTIPGLWGEHIHAVLIGDERMSQAAADQVDDYFAGRNGLANNGSDDGPRDYVHNRFTWVDPTIPKLGIQLCIAGDWNEPASSTGRFSPAWIARQGGLKIPDGLTGIDYPLSSAPVSNVRKLGHGGSDHPMVAFDLTNPATGAVLRCATWNVERDRTGDRRKQLSSWLLQVAEQEKLNVIALQEVRQYHEDLATLDGWQPFTKQEPAGVEHNAIIVRDGVRTSDQNFRLTSKVGWVTMTGGNHDPSSGVLVTVDGWLRFASAHEAPTVDWPARPGQRPVPVGPARRVAVRIASAQTWATIGRWWARRR